MHPNARRTEPPQCKQQPPGNEGVTVSAVLACIYADDEESFYNIREREHLSVVFYDTCSLLKRMGLGTTDIGMRPLVNCSACMRTECSG